MLSALISIGGIAMLDTQTLAKTPRPFFKRVGLPIGLQLYSLGDEPSKDIDATLARVAALGYRDIELPGMLGKSATELKGAADKAGLKYSSLHLPAAPLFGGTGLSLADPADKVAEIAGALGIKNVVMPIQLMPDKLKPAVNETFQNAIARGMAEAGADIWKRTAALLNEKAAGLKPHGISLGYHNHNIEFAAVGNTTGWEILMREIDPALITLELDIGWIAAAGLDPVAFLNKHRGRVRQMHIKDVKATTTTNFALSMDPTQIGDGKLDWARILPAAYKAGVRNFYVEQEPPFAMARMDAVKRSIDYLAALKA
jgi:sugar phosphate isomerase/epimerase